MRESDLYAPLRDHLQGNGYRVKGEVENCDLVACRETLWLAVEMKTRLNLDVILQAVQRQRLVDEVWIAIPSQARPRRHRRWQQLLHLLRRLEIGLFLIDVRLQPPRIEIALPALPFDRHKSRQAYRKQQKKLKSEFAARHGDQNQGGTTGRKQMTRYREDCLLLAGLLATYGPCSPKTLRQLGAGPKTQRMLYDNHYGWFERLGRGEYGLTTAGAETLREHQDLSTALLSELEPLKADILAQHKAAPGHHSRDGLNLEEKSMKEGG